MRVVEVTAFGAPDVLVPSERPDPVAGPGQLVVAAAACDVMFVDTVIRAGRGTAFFPIRPPYVPGNGLGGTVVSAGDGVEDRWAGRRVIAHTGGPGGAGGYAEQAVVNLEDVVAVPEDADLLAATALLHDGPTALRVAGVVGAQPGEWVLVLGAAGGMGILLVQLLRARGARIAGAARGRAKLEAVAEAGADVVVDYSSPGWTSELLAATGGARPEIVLDGVGGQLGYDAYGIIADGGRFSAHGGPSGSFAPVDPDDARRRRVSLTGIRDLQVPPGERSARAAELLPGLRSGQLRPRIGQTFSLAHAAQAHAAMEARNTIGKTLLTTQ